MNKGNALIYILLTVLIVGGIGWYLWNRLRVTNSEAESKKENIIVVDPQIISQDESTVKQIMGLDEHGNFPIVIDPNSVGKTNPFTK